MNKIVFATIVTVVTMRANAYVRPQVETNAVKIAEIERRMGGRVTPPSNGKTIVLWDSTGRAEKALEAFVKFNKGVMHFPAEMRDGAFEGDARVAAFGARNTMHPSVILIYSAKNEPAMSVFPDDAVALVNIAPLEIGNEVMFNDRVTKELFRAAGIVLCGYSLPHTPCVMEPVFSVFDLDAMKIKTLSPMRLNGMVKAAKKLDLKVARPVPYRIACQQGWAPAPTNDVQKAIWDQVHTIPTTPMKIEFDPKKGR